MNGWLIVNGFLHTKKFSELTDLFLLAAKRCGVSLTVYTNCEILVDVQENSSEVVIYLEEKNVVPEQYSSQETESKGFYDPVVVQDFPLRGKKLFLNIRRRRWILKKSNEYISRNWRMVAEGTRMTQDFASFLKELY